LLSGIYDIDLDNTCGPTLRTGRGRTRGVYTAAIATLPVDISHELTIASALSLQTHLHEHDFERVVALAQPRSNPNALGRSVRTRVACALHVAPKK
jgi:hypothetical protein